ncbi:MAG: M1 family metallopeptidase, partial [Candidatus Bathyarchaeota archaeon]
MESSVWPSHYEIAFEPDLKTFTFHGKETVQLNIKKLTSGVALNAADIKIIDCYLVHKGETINVSIDLNGKKEELQVKFSKKVKGNATLFIDFEGNLNDNLAGFYRSKYRDPTGTTKYLATTQFEAADARRAFPCWDSPEYKATFTISLILDSKLTAISNMPELEIRNISKNKKIIKFDRTPPMSTYLVYVGVGEFEFLENKLNDVKLRVATTFGKKNQCNLAMGYLKKFLDFYQHYFQISYPLPKLDLIALPDFAAGAMENWGAITFREAALLYDSKTSSIATKQRIAEIISHELAHQWFGNLVTMKWWNDLWLNESFATFIANKSIEYFYPTWDIWSQFLNSTTLPALELDALKTSHPIEVDVRTPSQIREIFDAISYNKGGSILKMLEVYLGEEIFRQGLKAYLLNNRYGNATTENLWSTLEKVSRKPIKKIMDTWINQTGYPLVDVNVKNSELILKQRKFLLERRVKNDKSIW